VTADKTVTVAVERFTLGEGYIVEPMQFHYTSGMNYATLLDEVFKKQGITYKHSGSVTSGFYLSAIKKGDTGQPNFSSDLKKLASENGLTLSEKNENGTTLSEFSYSETAGWMYSVNNQFPSVGMSDTKVKEGDVFRVQFSVVGLGLDLGSAYQAEAAFNSADKTALTKKVAAINATKTAWLGNNQSRQVAYQTAVQTLENLSATQTSVDQALTQLEQADGTINSSGSTDSTSSSTSASSTDSSSSTETSSTTSSTADSSTNSSDSATNSSGSSTDSASNGSLDVAALLAKLTNYVAGVYTKTAPTYGDEWSMMDLARNGYDYSENSSILNTYYANLVQTLTKQKGVLTTNKYTEYARVVLAVSAIGKEASNIAGYNLFDPLSDYQKVVAQGINGAIFALIAVNAKDSYAFTTPTGVSNYTTTDKLLTYILNHELANGGWALTGSTADTDITAMTLQALAPYQTKNATVKAAIERGVAKLATMQNSDGTFGTGLAGSGATSESIAQVITALSALGIDANRDSRFVKKGTGVVDALALFSLGDGTFMHMRASATSNGGATPGNADGMATEQAFYALIAYNRFVKGQSSLYNMNDETKNDNAGKKTPVPEPTPVPPADKEDNQPAGPTADGNHPTSSGSGLGAAAYAGNQPASPFARGTASIAALKKTTNPESATTKAATPNKGTTKTGQASAWDFAGDTYIPKNKASAQNGQQNRTTQTKKASEKYTPAVVAGVSAVGLLAAVGNVWFVKRKELGL
jgi:hypothetical protein